MSCRCVMVGIDLRWVVVDVGSRGRCAFHNWSCQRFPTHSGRPRREVQARWSLASSSTIASGKSRQRLHDRGVEDGDEAEGEVHEVRRLQRVQRVREPGGIIRRFGFGNWKLERPRVRHFSVL